MNLYLVDLSEGPKATGWWDSAKINVWVDECPAGQGDNPLESSIKSHVEASWRTSNNTDTDTDTKTTSKKKKKKNKKNKKKNNHHHHHHHQ